jgi:hypothetical protein
MGFRLKPLVCWELGGTRCCIGRHDQLNALEVRPLQARLLPDR